VQYQWRGERRRRSCEHLDTRRRRNWPASTRVSDARPVHLSASSASLSVHPPRAEADVCNVRCFYSVWTFTLYLRLAVNLEVNGTVIVGSHSLVFFPQLSRNRIFVSKWHNYVWRQVSFLSSNKLGATKRFWKWYAKLEGLGTEVPQWSPGPMVLGKEMLGKWSKSYINSVNCIRLFCNLIYCIYNAK